MKLVLAIVFIQDTFRQKKNLSNKTLSNNSFLQTFNQNRCIWFVSAEHWRQKRKIICFCLDFKLSVKTQQNHLVSNKRFLFNNTRLIYVFIWKMHIKQVSLLVVISPQKKKKKRERGRWWKQKHKVFSLVFWFTFVIEVMFSDALFQPTAPKYWFISMRWAQ